MVDASNAERGASAATPRDESGYPGLGNMTHKQASRRDDPEAWVSGGHEKFETPVEVVTDAAKTRGPEHVHEWSALWAHFGEYGDQDAHYHACLSDDHAPGYPCRVKLVGKCPACKNGLAASDSAAAQAALQNG